jgi:putative acetyltransferase
MGAAHRGGGTTDRSASLTGRDPVIIRPERPQDLEAIRRVNVAAFEGHQFSQQTEHLIVEALRAADALEVSLVAELDGSVVGHIAFSQARIGEAGSGWFLLGPVAVLPDHQARGIGRKLVEAGLGALRSRQALGCVLVGDPAFYARFGFEQDPKVTWAGVPAGNLLCVHFAGPAPAGEVSYHPAFSIGPEGDHDGGQG